MTAIVKAPPEEELSWLERDRSNAPVPSLHNAKVMIHRLGIACSYNAFHDRILIGTRDGCRHEVSTIVGEISDAALGQLRDMMLKEFLIDPAEKHVWDAVNILAHRNRFDPVLDMLDEAQANWDGVERLDSWVVNYLGCDDALLNRVIGRKVLVAAIRRARDPGCKFDNITVLEGPEGRNKSSAIEVLAGRENFSDQSVLHLSDKDIQEALRGVWMHENADLAGMRRADVEHLKAVLSRHTDRARKAFGKAKESYRRRSIEWGSTNNKEYLQSPNGNRRFWPLEVGVIKIEELRKDRLQLLGEAAVAEQTGESLLMDPSLYEAIGEAQEQRRTKHPWDETLREIPETILPLNGHSMNGHAGDGEFGIKIIHRGFMQLDGAEVEVERVASSSILTHVLGIRVSDQDVRHSMQVANSMKINGWQRSLNKNVYIDGGSVRGFWRKIKTPIPGVGKE